MLFPIGFFDLTDEHKTEIAIVRDYKDNPALVGLLRLFFISQNSHTKIFILRKSELLHVYKYLIGKSPLTQRQLK